MIGRALDDNNDLFLQDGSIALVDEGAEVVQHVRTRLLFYQGEWFLDLTAGVAYFQDIFIKPVNLSNIESVLKTEILLTDGVEKLIAFSMDYVGESQRQLTVEFSAETIYGIIDKQAVTING